MVVQKPLHTSSHVVFRRIGTLVFPIQFDRSSHLILGKEPQVICDTVRIPCRCLRCPAAAKPGGIDAAPAVCQPRCKLGRNALPAVFRKVEGEVVSVFRETMARCALLMYRAAAPTRSCCLRCLRSGPVCGTGMRMHRPPPAAKDQQRISNFRPVENLDDLFSI